MTVLKKASIALLPLLAAVALVSMTGPGMEDTAALEECTIGAAVGSVTADGRPMIWKQRDWREVDNEVFWNRGEKYAYLSVGSAGAPNTLMGLNEVGFAILNSVSGDLPGGGGGFNNATIQSHALGTCATVEEFEELLKRTDRSGRSTQANLAVMDSTGRAAIFETATNEYWRYEAGDPREGPEGYVLRTNFAFNGGGQGGIERFRRTSDLIPELIADGGLSHIDVLRIQMRDFSDSDSQPIDIPFAGTMPGGEEGWFPTRVSVCRQSTVSATLFHGVKPGEQAIATTMWTILGQPALSIAVPLWAVGEAPPAMNGPRTAPLCDETVRLRGIVFGEGRYRNWIDTRLLRDGRGGGLWSVTFAAEDSILSAAAPFLAGWRNGTITRDALLEGEYALADYAWRILKGWEPD